MALAGSLARQIKAKDEAENARERLRLRAHEDRLIDNLRLNAPLQEVLTSAASNLRQMMLADGFAAVSGEALLLIPGRFPTSTICAPSSDLFCRK